MNLVTVFVRALCFFAYIRELCNKDYNRFVLLYVKYIRFLCISLSKLVFCHFHSIVTVNFEWILLICFSIYRVQLTFIRGKEGNYG